MNYLELKDELLKITFKALIHEENEVDRSIIVETFNELNVLIDKTIENQEEPKGS